MYEGFKTNELTDEGKKNIEEISQEFDALLRRLAACNTGRYGALMVTHLEIASDFAKKSISTRKEFKDHSVEDDGVFVAKDRPVLLMDLLRDLKPLIAAPPPPKPK